MNASAPAIAQVIASIRGFLGERLSTAQAMREQHSRGEDTTPPTLPDAVAFVQTTDEVSRIMVLCHQHGVPVVPFGAGCVADLTARTVAQKLGENFVGRMLPSPIAPRSCWLRC